MQILIAQTKIKVSGLIITESQKPADFVSVNLLNAKDSSFVKGALTDADGRYIFDQLSPGNYFITGTKIGYLPASSRPFSVGQTLMSFSVPSIQLLLSARELNAVTITTTRPTVEQRAGVTVVNVENSILAAGNNAMDILSRSPGVTVDKDDHISLRGKQGVAVLIDGKSTYLSAEQLGQLLRSTDGSTIKSIELIPNPSAKYDAAGTAGIINIKLKKNNQQGSNGNMTAGISYGKHFSDNSSLSISHKVNKINLFATLSHTDNKNESNTHIKRIADSAGRSLYFDQYNYEVNTRHNNSYRAGADLQLNTANTLGFSLSGYNNPSGKTRNNPTFLGPQPNDFTSHLNTIEKSSGSHKNIALNLNDKVKLDTSGMELGVDLDYSKFSNNAEANYTTSLYDNNSPTPTSMLIRQNTTPSRIIVHTAKADYIYPISKSSKLDAGLKYSYVNTDNDQQAKLQVDKIFVNDTARSNHFDYNERISAGYLNLSKKWKSTVIEAGIRAEYTQSKGDLITTNNLVKRHYFNLFPNISVNRTIDDKKDLTISYSRRIKRPGYDILNPFIAYDDQYTYTKGNSFLGPSFSSKFQLNYTYNKSINLSLGYEHTSDLIAAVPLADTLTNATVFTSLNLNSSTDYSVGLGSPFALFKWWSGYISLNGLYNKTYNNQNLTGLLNQGKITFQGFVSQTFTLGKVDRVEINSVYQSGLVSGFLNIKSFYKTDAGMSHSFLNQAATVKLSVDDVFNTFKPRVISTVKNNQLDYQQRPESRIVRFTFSYKFGNAKIKAARHVSGIEDEQKRIKQ